MKKIFISFLIASFCTISIAADQSLPPEQVDRLSKAIKLIQQYYIKPENEKKLMDDALTGMIKQLDPHSEFLTGDNINDIETSVTGKFVGIGVELTADRGI